MDLSEEAEEAWNNKEANAFGSFSAGDMEVLAKQAMSNPEIVAAEGMRLGTPAEMNGTVQVETFEDFCAKADKVTEGFKGFNLEV